MWSDVFCDYAVWSNDYCCARSSIKIRILLTQVSWLLFELTLILRPIEIYTNMQIHYKSITPWNLSVNRPLHYSTYFSGVFAFYRHRGYQILPSTLLYQVWGSGRLPSHKLWWTFGLTTTNSVSPLYISGIIEDSCFVQVTSLIQRLYCILAIVPLQIRFSMQYSKISLCFWGCVVFS